MVPEHSLRAVFLVIVKQPLMVWQRKVLHSLRKGWGALGKVPRGKVPLASLAKDTPALE